MLFELQTFSGGVYPQSATSRTISSSISNGSDFSDVTKQATADLQIDVCSGMGGGGGGGLHTRVHAT